ncbi:hypothetical protein SAMN05660420_02933 [Desulfuromusa kysingii]|uniref:Uncharacterized protein n=1 Tax=Desulfuromusa kysingii TaxID=37625 RepID=A0A1H4DG10_9BACT|nr:hypothetical protein [Desulfuromusa kysingii]SEA71537.1 hypothetical protein SAMN05660420_02933 [Desulfuromusa kysingii]
MKKLMTTIIYLSIVMLSSYEVVPKLVNSINQKQNSIPYVAHGDETATATKQIDYKHMLKKSGAHAEMRF